MKFNQLERKLIQKLVHRMSFPPLSLFNTRTQAGPHLSHSWLPQKVVSSRDNEKSWTLVMTAWKIFLIEKGVSDSRSLSLVRRASFFQCFIMVLCIGILHTTGHTFALWTQTSTNRCTFFQNDSSSRGWSTARKTAYNFFVRHLTFEEHNLFTFI